MYGCGSCFCSRRLARSACTGQLELFPSIDEAPLLSLRDVDGDLSVYGAEQVVENPLDGTTHLAQRLSRQQTALPAPARAAPCGTGG